MTHKSKAFFFDRDGIVNRRIVGDYVKQISEFAFEEVFFDFFRQVKEKGYLAILVTNQQCVGKGIISEKRLNEIHDYMQTELYKNTGYSFDAIYFCPDLADSGSKHRKPEVGMFLEAINDHNIDTKVSFTIGDSVSDVVAGKKVGTTTILIGNYDVLSDINEADYVYSSLGEAGQHIC